MPLCPEVLRAASRSPAGLARLSAPAALAAVALAAGPSQAATLFHSVQQTFSVSDFFTIDEQTIFAPENVSTSGGGQGVSGSADLTGVQRITLPSFDTARGTLTSATLEITSKRIWSTGVSAASLESKPGGLLMFVNPYIWPTLNGQPFARSSLATSLACFIVNDVKVCADTDQERSSPSYAVGLDPADLVGGPVHFDLGYTLRASWFGAFSGPPLTRIQNSVDWNGTVTVTYGYTAAVPEPATWALLILGFGATGSVLRRTRRRLVAA